MHCVFQKLWHVKPLHFWRNLVEKHTGAKKWIQAVCFLKPSESVEEKARLLLSSSRFLKFAFIALSCVKVTIFFSFVTIVWRAAIQETECHYTCSIHERITMDILQFNIKHVQLSIDTAWIEKKIIFFVLIRLNEMEFSSSISQFVRTKRKLEIIWINRLIGNSKENVTIDSPSPLHRNEGGSSKLKFN